MHTHEVLLLLKAVTAEVRDGRRVLNGALDVFSDVVEAKEAPPTLRLHVLEDHVSANIRLVAAHDSRWQDTAVRLHVAHGNIVDINERLSLTGNEGIEHAARAATARLLLLLRPNVDGPPDCFVNYDVIIEYVRNAST